MSAPKHILVSVVGLTPQVITETLYYFWCRAPSQVPITEVFALTTLPGKNKLEKALLLIISARIKINCCKNSRPSGKENPQTGKR